mgnify:CR=1 FL=1
MNLKIGQEIDGKMIHSISLHEDTRDMTRGDSRILRKGDSLDSIRRHSGGRSETPISQRILPVSSVLSWVG